MRTISVNAIVPVHFILAAGCAPPPELVLPGDTAAGPSIEILYPEQGEVLTLESGCGLVAPIIVYVEGLELSEFDLPDADGQGHWHGGPSLERGYCAAQIAYCEGRNADAEKNEDNSARYDGRGQRPGRLTLQVELQSNSHEPLGVEDQVEVVLAAPPGETCP
jgi:hypothetical protein